MRKRNLKKTILAAALAVPVAFSYPGWAVRAQEDEKVSTETEAQEVMQDNTAPEEAECEENPDWRFCRKTCQAGGGYYEYPQSCGRWADGDNLYLRCVGRGRTGYDLSLIHI